MSLLFRITIFLLVVSASALLLPPISVAAHADTSPAPFTSDERAGWLRVLARSESSTELSKLVRELDSRDARAEPKLAQALLSAADRVKHHFRKQQFRRLTTKFDVNLKPVLRDLNQYAGSGPVTRVGPPVPIHAVIPKGTVLALRRGDAKLFDPIHVIGGDGSDRVIYTKGLSKVVRSAPKDAFHYAPETVPQPESFVPTPVAYDPASPFEESREWNDITGRFQIQAKLVAISDDQVQLQKQNGLVIDVPLHQLSLIDADYIRMRQDLAANLLR